MMNNANRKHWKFTPGRRTLVLLGVGLLLLLFAVPVIAQVGGGFDLSWNAIAGGGNTAPSTGGVYGVSGTIGQSGAAQMSGGVYGLSGGFWAATLSSPTATVTPTGTATNTPAATNTPTTIATPAGEFLVGHVTWQGPPAQPSVRQQLPVTLTLCIAGTPASYGGTTDSSGFFTLTLSLAPGNYNWRAKGPKYLGTAGTVALGVGTTQLETGTERAGDVDSTHNNIINSVDFNVLKSVFGQASSVGDLNNDGVTNATDFNLLKGNFGQAGASLTCP